MISGFFESLSAYFKALALIPKFNLWKQLLVPCFVGLCLAIALGGTIFLFGDNLGNLLTGWIPLSESDSWLATIWNGIASALKTAGGIMGTIISLAIAIIAYKNLFLVVVGPFLSPLTEKVEEKLTGRKVQSPPFFKSFIRGLRLALRNIFKELFWVAVLFIFGLFPLFSIPAAILIFIVQAYFTGAGNFDFTLERHLNRKESIRFVKSNRWLAIGNGAVFLLLLGIGIGFIIAPPLAAIAATLSTVDKLESYD